MEQDQDQAVDQAANNQEDQDQEAVEEAVDNTAALTQVLQGILTWLNNAGAPGGGQPPAPAPAVYDLYGHTNPHNLATKTGLTAYQDSCQPLSTKWDGTVEKFPPFLIELRRRFEEFNWNASGPSGIHKVSGKNLLSEYHSITTDMVEAAFNGRTNDRAIQNCRALYKLLLNSITGELKKILFETADTTNRPRKDDGIDLLIKMIATTTLSSIQTSIKATNKLTTYCPSKAKFNLPQVNSDMNHYMILATTSTRKFEDIEQISITMAIYDKIKQPQEWVAWLQQKKIEFNRGQIVQCASFQAEAVATYNQISDDQKDGKFKGSLHTVQEEVVAMLADKLKPTGTKRTARGSPKPNTENDDPNNGDKRNSRPPFLKWNKVTLKNGDLGESHKIGDTRDHEGKTYHYCDCPWHRGGIKWHTFTAADCRTRKRWLEKKGAPADNENKDVTANLADKETGKPTLDQDKIKEISTMLGDVMQSLSDDDSNTSVPQALLADALSAVSDLA